MLKFIYLHRLYSLSFSLAVHVMFEYHELVTPKRRSRRLQTVHLRFWLTFLWLKLQNCVQYSWVCYLSTGCRSAVHVFHFWFNRPLALRGHVTNASLKQLVVILLLPKIDRTHKNYLTPEIWEEGNLREIFYGTFQQSSMTWIGRHVTLALQHDRQNYFLLISC